MTMDDDDQKDYISDQFKGKGKEKDKIKIKDKIKYKKTIINEKKKSNYNQIYDSEHAIQTDDRLGMRLQDYYRGLFFFYI